MLVCGFLILLLLLLNLDGALVGSDWGCGGLLLLLLLAPLLTWSPHGTAATAASKCCNGNPAGKRPSGINLLLALGKERRGGESML